ncbi:Kif14 [Symbiodinium natans]|uniref:Kif14 protein n=1 Tax=Symbiodinium natans TaxID=878477 RepID=A0A812IQZ2_9DINO|nr:Kif14 [Symbiodinium natans]
MAISVEFFEVINELVFDLLATEEKIESGHRTRFQTGGETHVEGVPRRGCRTADEMRAFLAHGLRQRELLATGRPAGGQSRSTLLFTFCVDVFEGVDRELKRAVLQFIRLPSTSRPPSRPLRESESSSAVVMSLSSVSTVFSYLIPQNRGRKRTIPWRDSCCTRLLYNALRNGAHVVFIGTVSSSEDAVEDTFDTLRFLQRVREAVTTEPLQAPTTREAPLSFATPPETTAPP